MFRDEHIARMKAGSGGNGSVAFIRESNMPKGGPAGGDGGRGGDVILVADENYNTLYHLTHQPRFVAQSGENGSNKNCSGKSGRDLLIQVPVGTLVRDIERNVLIAFDLLLVVVLGLLLYSVSARDPTSPPGVFDLLQVVLVVGALLADAVALWAIGARISEFGFSANRVAALGMNLILLVNLGWSAVLYVRFLRGRGASSGIER